MKITVSGSKLPARCDCFIIPLYGDDKDIACKLVSRADGKLIHAAWSARKKTPNKLLYFHTPTSPYGGILLVDVGKKKDVDDTAVRNAAGKAVGLLKQNSGRNLALCTATGIPFAPFLEGLILGSYRHDGYKSKVKRPYDIKSLCLVDIKDAASAKAEAAVVCARAESANWARDLANAPANMMTPSILADRAKAMADETGCEFRALNEKQIRKEGMGCLLGVAQGSKEEARLITVKYSHPDATKTIALVGKGVTFDAGGISIKGSRGMQDMKFDMSGAAAVLGAIRSIALLKPVINAVAVVPAAENLPDGGALKPGDIITASNGKTVEVISTDAEGRLILADALVYAEKTFAPDAMADIATLTGSVGVALGNEHAGVLSRHDEIVDQLIAAGEAVNECLWRLPMNKPYDGLLDSKNADIINTSTAGAGTIAGAMFLSHFVKKTPWAHLDIAGTAYGVKSKPYWDSSYATGFGSRLLTEWVIAQAASREY
jgi:leucyl aminopeptidase